MDDNDVRLDRYGSSLLIGGIRQVCVPQPSSITESWSGQADPRLRPGMCPGDGSWLRFLDLRSPDGTLANGAASSQTGEVLDLISG